VKHTSGVLSLLQSILASAKIGGAAPDVIANIAAGSHDLIRSAGNPRLDSRSWKGCGLRGNGRCFEAQRQEPTLKNEPVIAALKHYATQNH
jgi:hypothetical protein